MTAQETRSPTFQDFGRALRSSGYRRLWIAAVVSRAGDVVNFVALALFVLGATGSPVAVSTVVLSEAVGLIAGGLAAQLIVDRLPPARVLVGADVGRAAAALFLAVAPSFPLAVAIAFLLAAATAVFNPVSAAVVPRLVKDELLPAANTLTWSAGVVPQIIAASAGGLLVAAASARVAFGVNAASFVVSAALLAGLPRLAPASLGRSAWRQLPEIARAIRAVPVLRPLLLVQALAALSVGATSALLVVLARSAYGLNAAGYGIWLSVIGVGAVVGPLTIARALRRTPWQTVSSAFVARGAGDIGMGLLSQSVAGGALLFVYALNTSTGMIAFQTLMQRAVPEAVRARSFAVLDVVWQIARLVSIAAGGAIAAAAGVRIVYVIGGSLLIAAGVAGWLTLGQAMASPAPQRAG